MKTFLNLALLNFIPRSPDLGLLVLRLWLGASMLMLHGMTKIKNFDDLSGKFADPFGIGPKASLGLAIFSEAVCSVLLILGLFTRFAAIALIVTMAVAFFIAHKGVLSGPKSGELAFIYLAGYVVLLLAGPGRFALDAKMTAKAPAKPKAK
jgi:putative oxidoreductase